MGNTQNVKVLRIGIILNGKIINEKIIYNPVDITIGTDKKCTFCISESQKLPKEITVFTVKNKQYNLVFTDKLSGQVIVKNAEFNLQSLKAQTTCQKKGNNYYYPLDIDSKGRIDIEDVIVLFQFIPPPPEPPKPQIPEIAKGYWLKKMDKPFMAIFMASFVAHFGFVFGVRYFAEPPKEPTINDIPDRFVKMIMPEKEIRKKKDKVDDGAGKESKRVETKKVATKATTGDSKGGGQAKGIGRQTAEEVRNKVMGTGILKVIGSLSDGEGDSPLADVLRGGGRGGKLEESLNQIGSIGIATEEGQATRLGAGGSGGPASIGDLASKAEVGQVGGGTGEKIKTASISGKITNIMPEIDGKMDQAKINAIIKSKQKALQDCYERELRKNPNLSGKIVVRFTIGEDGKVTDVRIESDSMGSAEVADCLISRIRRWIFPKPDEGSVTVSVPFVFVKT
ncbi:MAG: TonB family protein [Deltaproteobacteria bacterium]|nr:TonB family protein [Deltaproteobacteria bacterium]